MNIRVIKDSEVQSDITGGEYGIPRLDIYIDPDLPERTQRMLVIHCILENYNRSIPHEKVEELCQILEDALDLI